MDDSDVVSFKIYLFSNESEEPEIRRFGVQASFVRSFNFLTKRIAEVFPRLSDKSFTVTWKDEEGDEVSVSSDSELLIALTSMKTDVKKFFLRIQLPTAGLEKEGANFHPGVYCDGCDCNIVGYRYKCLLCRDYDLCSGCEQGGIHPEHIMLRIPDPYCFEHMNIRKVAHFIKSFVPEMRHHDSEHLYASKKRRKYEKYEKRRSCPMAEAPPDSTQFLKWGLGALQKLLDPLGATVEIQVPRKDEEKGKGKAEEKQDKEKPAPTPGAAPAPGEREVRFSGVEDISGTMKQKIDELSKMLASQAVSNSAEDDGWVAYEDLKKDDEEPRPSTSQSVPKEAKPQPSAPQATGKRGEENLSESNLYPELNAERLPKDPLVRDALLKMLSLGFTNEGGWLAGLLESKNGDINQVLDVLAPHKKVQ